MFSRGVHEFNLNINTSVELLVQFSNLAVKMKTVLFLGVFGLLVGEH